MNGRKNVISNSQQYCCIKMASILREHSTSLIYIPQTRTYFVEYHLYRKPRKTDAIECESINYCPFCGTKLPAKLNDELYRILQEEYRIEDTWNQIEAGNIPEEFKTDEWWKKRRL